MRLHILAILLVLGIFTRITFIGFAFPMAAQVLRWTFFPFDKSAEQNKPFTWFTNFRTLLVPGVTAILAITTTIAIDTFYFHPNRSFLVVTPLNFLIYNLSPDNLAEHGLHSRWLHLLVNLPEMASPQVVWIGVVAASRHWTVSSGKKDDVNRIVDRSTLVVVLFQQLFLTAFLAILYTFIVAMALLSIQPHQEPRFLTALISLSVIFIANSGYLLRSGKLFWVCVMPHAWITYLILAQTSWIIYNALLSLFFGVLHQGGVVPSLFLIRSQIIAADVSQTHIVYWKTYMPPWHLLMVNERGILVSKIMLALRNWYTI